MFRRTASAAGPWSGCMSSFGASDQGGAARRTEQPPSGARGFSCAQSRGRTRDLNETAPLGGILAANATATRFNIPSKPTAQPGDEGTAWPGDSARHRHAENLDINAPISADVHSDPGYAGIRQSPRDDPPRQEPGVRKGERHQGSGRGLIAVEPEYRRQAVSIEFVLNDR